MKSYILVADILGFSNIVSKLPPDTLSMKMDNWVNLVEKTRRETNIDRTHLVSDTLFAQVADSEDGLKNLFLFSKLLLERCLEESLLIRGAISHGEASWSKESKDLIYGQAVLDAHRLESSLEWFGIACSPIEKELPWSWDLVCRYPVLDKRGEGVSYGAVIVWTPPHPLESSSLVEIWASKELHSKDKSFPWTSFTKLSNTTIFFEYVRQSKKKGLEPHEFDLDVFMDLYLPENW